MPTAKTLDEWVRIYEEKTSEKAVVPYGYRLFYLAERGFATMMPIEKDRIMIVYQVCGDAKFWRDLAEMYSASMGLDYVCTICTRHIRPYMRGFGWKIIAESMNEEGEYRFLCEDGIGRKVVITHEGLNTKGEAQYYVTHCLNDKAAKELAEKDFAQPGALSAIKEKTAAQAAIGDTRSDKLKHSDKGRM